MGKLEETAASPGFVVKEGTEYCGVLVKVEEYAKSAFVFVWS
jgi:hypothetical protein